MDLSEGEGEEADAVYQEEDINEDDLLGSDEDEGACQTNFLGSSRKCETNQGNEDEYDDVLDLDLGEGVDELELVPEATARVAPVKVRPGIVQEKKAQHADSTSSDAVADQVNEIGSQTHSQCDSSAHITEEDVDNDGPEENKAQRSRFVTERPGLEGRDTGDRSSNLVGNPIQTLGQRNGRNFLRQPSPRTRTNQIRQMGPRHPDSQTVGPQTQFRPFVPNRHRLPRGMVRGQVNPLPGQQQGLLRRGLPRDQPILQFPGQIFTDFTKPMRESPVQTMSQNQLSQNGRPDTFLQQRLPAPRSVLLAPNGHAVIQQHSGPQDNRAVQQFDVNSIPQSSPQESRGTNITLERAESHITPLISGGGFPRIQGPNFLNAEKGFRSHLNNSQLPVHTIQNAGIRVGPTGPGVPGMFRPQLQPGIAPEMPTMGQPNTRFPQQLFPNQPRAMNIQMQFQGPRPEIGLGNPHFQQIRFPGAVTDNPYWRGPHPQNGPFFAPPPDNSNFHPHGNLDFGYRHPFFSPTPNGWNLPSQPTSQIGPSNAMFPPAFNELHPMYQEPLYNYRPMHTLSQPNMAPLSHGSRDIAQELMFPSQISNFNNQSTTYGVKMQQLPIDEREADFERKKYSERDHHRNYTRKYSPENDQFGKRKFEYDTRLQERPEKKMHSRLGPPVSSSRGDSREDQIVKIIMETKKEMGIDDKYLQQIEDQKNKRAEVMRLKEERRRLAAVNAEGSKLKSGQETGDEKKSKSDARESSSVKSTDRPQQSRQEMPFSQSIHINPLAFKGDLTLLNTNLKKINMNVSNVNGSVSSARQAANSQVRVLATSDEPKQQVSGSSQRPRKILRIVKNKNGEVIRKSKVIILRKPNQDSNQD